MNQIPSTARVNRYQQTQIGTADQRELVLYLYDGAITRLNRAIGAVKREDRGTRSLELARAMDIVMELLAGLDFEQGGEIAQNLASLYSYAVQELMQANTSHERSQTLESIRRAMRVLNTLREAWSQVLRLPQAACAESNVKPAHLSCHSYG